MDSLKEKISHVLSDMQDSMLSAARKFQADNTHEAKNYQDFKDINDFKKELKDL